MRLKKMGSIIRKSLIAKMNYISMPRYMKMYKRYLLSIGVDVCRGEVGYIDPSVQFDGAGYRLISIGEKVTISKDVLFLVHDYSINRGLEMKNVKGKYQFLKPVKIGRNCFIGARCILLPGTTVGENCILGAGSVVKGTVPDNSVVCGNPARVICTINEWTERHMAKQDYVDAK